jgi:hypothetical protein
MTKYLITPLFFFILAATAFAQPPSQDLSAIDPRLTNGFTMLAMKLTAAEFKGKVPKGTSSTSDIKTLIGLRKLQTLQVSGSKSKYLFQIIPYFSFNSWLADSIRKDPETLTRVLNHEQNHYDIHLLMAAELKKELSSTFFDSRNYAEGILQIRNKLLLQESKTNQLYEIETNNGQDADAQKKWDERVSSKSWVALVTYVNGKI